MTYTTSLRHKRMQFVPSSLNVRRHHSPLYAHLAHGTRTTLHQPTRALFFISRGMHVHPSSRFLPFNCWPAIDLPAVLAYPSLHTIGRRAHGQRAHAPPPLVCEWVGGALREPPRNDTFILVRVLKGRTFPQILITIHLPSRLKRSCRCFHASVRRSGALF